MNADERFIELWNDYLEGELDESGIAELRALVAEDDRLLETAADSYQTHRLLGLVAQDSPARQEAFVRETLDRLPADSNHFVEGAMGRLSGRETRRATTPRTFLAKWLVPIAAAAAIALLIVGLCFRRPSAEREIAKIAGLSGSVQWTGDGGRVRHDLSVGTELPGGTVEGLTPGSWLELKFNDGSSVTILGSSMLTFSDHGQKKLHLREGNLSGAVRPQPAGKPMLIHTRSAQLEVLGTQFDVEAGLAATMLNVSEGKVRVRRLSDGRTVDVPAKHRVIAAADREMRPAPAPEAIGRWRSQLHLGPDGVLGKWMPGMDAEDAKGGATCHTTRKGRTLYTASFGVSRGASPPVILHLGPDGAPDARLRAIPYTTPQGGTIYTAAFGVSRGDRPPVILQPDSHLRVRGRMASTHQVYFGVTVRHPNGEFAGRFQTTRPAVDFQSGPGFEVLLFLRDFRLDPSLVGMEDKLPGDPSHLVVESIWCHTLDKQAGLELSEVELIPPTPYRKGGLGRQERHQ